MKRILSLLLFALALFALVERPVTRHLKAAGLLLALSSSSKVEAGRLVEQELTVPGRDGTIRARLYRRSDVRRGPGLVVAHGVHYRGIDERRLVPFARELARAGLVVITPELRDLMDYRITARGIGEITDAAQALRQSELIAQSRVGLLGFSFAGGLSLLAAGRSELREAVAYVVSVGGYHDLERVLGFLMTNEIDTPQGRTRLAAHEYGLVVLAYQNLDRLVPEADRPLLAATLRAWLHEDFDEAWARASARATPAGERLFSLVASGRLREIEDELRGRIEERHAELVDLSPRGKLHLIDAPVYLLHGSGDAVIPPTEVAWAERELAENGQRHLALVSPLLEHVELERGAQWLHQVSLWRFMAQLF
jgi:dienelactone hydrolase